MVIRRKVVKPCINGITQTNQTMPVKLINDRDVKIVKGTMHAILANEIIIQDDIIHLNLKLNDGSFVTLKVIAEVDDSEIVDGSAGIDLFVKLEQTLKEEKIIYR